MAAAGDDEVTYYTVADHGFFLGAVALLNSLRLTRNAGRVVVLDVGLTPQERDVLADHATVVTPPRRITGNPTLMKPYAHFLEPSGIVVVIDSDIIVTGSLGVAVALAKEGKICAFPAWARYRWYAEWEELLKLRAPLRREEHVNAGFVAFSTRHWPDLLKRWWELCELVPAREVFGAGSVFFYAGDQDALNALLMSEISRGALARLPDRDSAFAAHVSVDDIDELVCTLDGHRTTILHYLDSPKPWQRSGWLRLAATSYVRLLRRLLFGADLLIRVDAQRVPLWLRPTVGGEVALRVLGATNQAIVSTSHRLPEPVIERLRRARRRLG